MKLFKVIFLTLMLFCSISPVYAYINSSKDHVILLHGIARSSSHMEDLENYLQQDYEVINMNYPSTDYSLERLVEITHEELSSKITENKIVHFIGYSMGGLLVRAIINKYRPKNLGRVVLLAPPNNGSEVADFLKNNWLYEKIYGPAGQQLITKGDLGDLLGEVDYELGIIAGNSSIDPISSIIIPGDDDGKVSIKSTKIKAMRDHIVISASHSFFPNNKKVIYQADYFLKHGVFNRNSDK